MHFFRRNRLVGARKNPDRLEIHAFSERAIFEAIGLRGIIRFQENITWKKGNYKHIRYLSFFISLAIVLILFLGFGYVIHSADNQSGASINLRAVYWFAGGNILYYLTGIILAVKMKDNRAFCKYLCPA